MQRRWQWTMLWLFCAVGWMLAIAYVVQDVRGGMLDLSNCVIDPDEYSVSDCKVSFVAPNG